MDETGPDDEEQLLSWHRETFRFFRNIEVNELPNIRDLQQISSRLLYKTEIIREGLMPTAHPIARRWVARHWRPLWRMEDLRPINPEEQELKREVDRIHRRRRQKMREAEAEFCERRAQLFFSGIREVVRSALGPDTLWLDLETTGLGKTDEVIEITLISDEGLLLNSLVRPLHLKSWEEAQSINGISPDMLSTAPEPADLQEAIQSHIQGKILACYNAAFDLEFLARLLGEKGTHPKSFCIMKAFAKYYGQYSEQYDDYITWSLADAGRYFDLEMEDIDRRSVAKCTMGRLVHHKLAHVDQLPLHHYLIAERNLC